LQTDENNCDRSLKRSRVVRDDGGDKENTFYLPPPVSTRIRRGVVKIFFYLTKF